MVGEALNEILPRCRGRIFVSTFSSNIHRIQQVVDASSFREIFRVFQAMGTNLERYNIIAALPQQGAMP